MTSCSVDRDVAQNLAEIYRTMEKLWKLSYLMRHIHYSLGSFPCQLLNKWHIITLI